MISPRGRVSPDVLIVGANDDVHVTSVLDRIDSLGRNALVFDAPSLVGWVAHSGPGGTTFENGADGVRFRVGSGPLRGWIRRVAPPGWHSEHSPVSRPGVIGAAWMSLLSGVVQSIDCEWITGLMDQLSAENKLLQLTAAAGLGIAIPNTTIITSNEDSEGLPDHMVIKPLGPSFFVEDGATKRVPATPIRRGDLNGMDLSAAPFLVQEELEAECHLRVVTVGRASWVCTLSADGLPVDWRERPDAHDSFVYTADFPDVEQKALQLAGHLRVGFSSQDWLVTASRSVFLDLNPAGQWLFLPVEAASAITDALAHWLSGASG